MSSTDFNLMEFTLKNSWRADIVPLITKAIRNVRNIEAKNENDHALRNGFNSAVSKAILKILADIFPIDYDIHDIVDKVSENQHPNGIERSVPFAENITDAIHEHYKRLLPAYFHVKQKRADSTSSPVKHEMIHYCWTHKWCDHLSTECKTPQARHLFKNYKLNPAHKLPDQESDLSP